MELAHFIAFNLTLLAALASPGPAMLMALRTTLVEGRTAGILTGLGLGTVAAAWTGAALLGLDVIFTLFPWAYMTLKIVGAAYLIYLAIAIWREAKTPLDSAHASKRRPFVSGLLINFANPKSVLFASAVLVVIFPRDLTLAQKALIVGNHMLVEFAAYTAFACALSTRVARDGYLRLKPLLDRIAAGVLGALGLKLAFDRS